MKYKTKKTNHLLPIKHENHETTSHSNSKKRPKGVCKRSAIH